MGKGKMQSQVMPQAANTVIVQTVPASNSPRRENYAASQSLWLGALQIAAGVLCFLFQVIAIAINAGVAASGSGIWCGILFIIAGTFGVTASKYKTNCHIVTFMVMSIISAVLTVAVLATSATGVDYDRGNYYGYYGYDYHHRSDSIITFMIMSIVSAVVTVSVLTCSAIGLAMDNNDNYNYSYYDHSSNYYRYSGDTPSKRNSKLAMNALLVILALFECVIAIWSSAICCAGLCCTSRPQNGVVYGQAVQYQIPANGQQVVMINQPQGGYYPAQQGTAFIQVAPPQAMAPPAYNQSNAQPPMYMQPQQSGVMYPQQQQQQPNQGQAQPIPQKM